MPVTFTCDICRTDTNLNLARSLNRVGPLTERVASNYKDDGTLVVLSVTFNRRSP